MEYTTIIIPRGFKSFFDNKEEPFVYFLKNALSEALNNNSVNKQTKVEKVDMYSTTCYLPEGLKKDTLYACIDKRMSLSEFVRIALKNYIESEGHNKCSN